MNLDIQALRDSFEKVKPIAGQVASRFYSHLWAAHPESKALFANVHMDRQKAALMKSLTTIVEKLDQTDALVSYLKNMGARHVAYGTQVEHYPWVGAALIATLKDFLGEGWTPYLESQWATAYGVIADTMLKGAEEFRSNGPIVEPTSDTKFSGPDVGPLIDSAIVIPRELRALIRTKVRQRVRQLIQAEIEEAIAREKNDLEASEVAAYFAKVS